jgi:hypothetical protein
MMMHASTPTSGPNAEPTDLDVVPRHAYSIFSETPEPAGGHPPLRRFRTGPDRTGRTHPRAALLRSRVCPLSVPRGTPAGLGSSLGKNLPRTNPMGSKQTAQISTRHLGTARASMLLAYAEEQTGRGSEHLFCDGRARARARAKACLGLVPD